MSNVKLKDINGNDIEYPNVKLFIRDLDNNFTEFVEADNAPIPSLEGTAIPVGEVVEKIYFNTNNTIEETNAYLSQLTYVQTPLLPDPLHPIYAYTENSTSGIFIIAVKRDDRYFITAIWDVVTPRAMDLYDSGFELYTKNNGYVTDYNGEINVHLLFNGLAINEASLSEWNGLPIGTENEKIKNVLSITPFVAEGIAPTGSLTITENGLYDVTTYANVEVNIESSNGQPPEIATEAEMNALEVGSVFRYMGETTEAFENGAYYVVEESE